MFSIVTSFFFIPEKRWNVFKPDNLQGLNELSTEREYIFVCCCCCCCCRRRRRRRRRRRHRCRRRRCCCCCFC